MRIRIHFAKTEAMRFTSHLDLYRTWERMLRRAGLPLAYSQGFKPHPRIVLASALPLGITSQAEVVDVWLEQALPLREIESQLGYAQPPGLQVIMCAEVDQTEPALPTQVTASDFLITFPECIPDLEHKIEALLSAQSLPRTLRDKSYDLRPLIIEMEILDIGISEKDAIRVRLTAREGATGRPEEIVRALGESPEETHIHRIRLLFQEKTD